MRATQGLALSFFVAMVFAASAWASGPVSPGVPLTNSVTPPGVSRGTRLMIQITGRRLAKTQGLLFFRPGIEVLRIGTCTDRRARLEIIVSEQCPLGEHLFHLRTTTGLSKLMSLQVSSMPILFEVEPNNTVAEAKVLPLNRTIHGGLPAKDIDVYALDLQPGRFAAEVEGLRLGELDCDTKITLTTANGKVVSTSDDTALGSMDPWISTSINSAGRYYLRIEETAFGGSSRHRYRLHVGDFPRPSGTLQTGIKPGAPSPVDFIDPAGSFEGVVRIPKDATGPEAVAVWPTLDGKVSPTPVFVVPSRGPEIVEGQTTHSLNKPFTAPAAISGRIDQKGQTDHWRFSAKKGQRILIESMAGRIRSPLDPTVLIREKGKKRNLLMLQDTGGYDGRGTFRVPKTGIFDLYVWDHLRRGGPEFTYRIEVGISRPQVTTVMELPSRTASAHILVPRGGTMGCVLFPSGINRKDGIEFIAHGLPRGVRARPARVHPGSALTAFILEADADAPLDATLVDLHARSDQSGDEFSAGFSQNITRVEVENNRIYLRSKIHQLPVAVVDALPFSVEVDTPKVPIIRNNSIEVSVRVKRAKGFKQPIRIRLLNTPTTLRGGRTVIPADKTVGKLTISQRGGVVPTPWMLAVVATADFGGPVSVCSDLFPLHVAAPHFIPTLGKARTQPGTQLALPISFKQRIPFIGRVQLTIPNLPKGIKATYPVVDQSTEVATIMLDVGPKVRPSRYRNLIVRCLVPVDGGKAMLQRGGGEVRIDRPRPNTKADAKKKAAAAKSTKKQKRAWGTVDKPKT